VRWWAEALGWQIVSDEEDEGVLVPPWMTADPVQRDAWDREPPGLVFVAVKGKKQVKNRLHLDLAAHAEDDHEAELARLIQLGARTVDVGQPADCTWTVLSDPEGNEFCMLSPRRR
jgi:predicted enzyme related to lactoylglutathione lyase